MSETFYWYDFETFGVDPAKDKPCQFAGLRTDSDLNIIDEPLVIYCQPSQDCLPQPLACLVTGITPQIAWQQGLPEYKFAKHIHAAVNQAQTCAVGYNSMRFDSEVLRYLFFRNFYDPYAHEYLQHNSRWDLLDVMRAAYALRPEGLSWPKHESGEHQGKPSFKLEHLSVANGIEHSDAHDAMADVTATIALAKQLKQAQPKLFDYALSLRNKQTVKAFIEQHAQQAFVHVSGKLPATQACTSVFTPITFQTTNKNAVVCYDLRYSPSVLAQLSASEIQARLFTPIADLPDPAERVHLKGLHINKSPFIAPLKTLDEAALQKTAINLALCEKHLEELKQIPNLAEKVATVFDSATLQKRDAEQNLYGSFIPNEDKPKCERIRRASAADLENLRIDFSDARLNDLLLRYKARNFPEILSADEQQAWQIYRENRLLHKDAGASITLDEFELELQTLATTYADNPATMQILEELSEYASSLH